MKDIPSNSSDNLREIARLRERLLLAPQDARAMAELAALLERAGDLPAAVDLYQRMLRVDPYQLEALLALGRLWNALGDTARARSWFNRALALDPECVEASSGLARLSEGTLTQAYIRTLFDQYADRFDAELTGTLSYRAPELVGAALARSGIPPGSAGILDLGCGTGLSGLALRPFAADVDGVDLSPGMIAKARERGIYRHLAVAEALAFLEEADRAWGIVAAVDMLNYVGNLVPLFRAAAVRLQPKGLLVGTVEKREEGGLALTTKRRFTHGRDHLEQAVRDAGLVLTEMVEAGLRTEGGVEVRGLVFAARKAG